jgi:hypothetical protein
VRTSNPARDVNKVWGEKQQCHWRMCVHSNPKQRWWMRHVRKRPE